MADIPDRPLKPESFFWSPHEDVVYPMLKCFERYDPKFDNHAEARSLDFWVLCLRTQIAEMEKARGINDWLKVAYELADVISVAVDALAKTAEFGIYKYGDSWDRASIITGIIMERTRVNAKKQMENRDQKFYEEKLAELEAGKGISLR